MARYAHSLMLAASLGFAASAAAEVPKPSVSFSHYAAGTVYPGSTKHDIQDRKSEVRIEGDEKRVCSPNPADRSTASAVTSALNQRNDGGITEFDLNMFLTAKGGKYSSCFKCDGPQLCTEPGPDELTPAEASGSITATVTYRFPDGMRGASSYRLKVSAYNGRGINADGALEITMDRQKRPGEVKVKPRDTKYVDLTPGDELMVTVKLKGIGRAKGPAETFNDQVGAKIRIEMAEGPILEAVELQGYILNGRETTAFKSVGLIAQVDEDDGSLSAHCTGTVVGNRSILTAAHCVGDPAIQKVVDERRLVFIATDNISNATNPMVVTGFAYPKGEQPENFRFFEAANKSLEDDVAVLYTENPTGLQAMPMLNPPPLVDDIARNTGKVTFVGYGLNPSPTTTSRAAGVKREASGPISNPDNRTFMVTVQRAGSSTCRGDSGGPSLIEDGAGSFKIIGVTSYGARNCQSGYNMRVDHYRKWIERHIQ